MKEHSTFALPPMTEPQHTWPGIRQSLLSSQRIGVSSSSLHSSCPVHSDEALDVFTQQIWPGSWHVVVPPHRTFALLGVMGESGTLASFDGPPDVDEVVDPLLDDEVVDPLLEDDEVEDDVDGPGSPGVSPLDAPGSVPDSADSGLVKSSVELAPLHAAIAAATAKVPMPHARCFMSSEL